MKRYLNKPTCIAKNKIIILAAAGAMAAALVKNIVCKDQPGMITAEVKEIKQSTATSIITMGGSNGNVTATRK